MEPKELERILGEIDRETARKLRWVHTAAQVDRVVDWSERELGRRVLASVMEPGRP